MKTLDQLQVETDLALAQAHDAMRQLNEQFERTLALEVEVQLLRGALERAIELKNGAEAQAEHFLQQRLALEAQLSRVKDVGGEPSAVSVPEGAGYASDASTSGGSAPQGPPLPGEADLTLAGAREGCGVFDLYAPPDRNPQLRCRCGVAVTGSNWESAGAFMDVHLVARK